MEDVMRERTKLSEKQRGILRFIETFTDAHGYPPTIREIGQAIGIASTSVVNYNLDKLEEAGYLVRTSHSSRGIRLIKGAGTSGRKPALMTVQAALHVPRVPLIGQIVASAPVPIPDDMGHYYDDENMLDVPSSMLHGVDPAEVFALRVRGDSMIDAMIRNNDIVLFRRQNTASDGDMVAVWLIERGETTLKYFYPEGTRIRLQPAHPTMQPIYVDAATCEVQGRVLGVIRPSL
jgi:repressor LexA